MFRIIWFELYYKILVGRAMHRVFLTSRFFFAPFAGCVPNKHAQLSLLLTTHFGDSFAKVSNSGKVLALRCFLEA